VPFPTEPTRWVRSPDGTPIAVFELGDGPPLVLVHGATADHTTFRVLGPLLAGGFRLHALDRRGRGASGDGPAYAIEREFEDVATVAEEVAAERGGPVDVFGHSYGGRAALGAALRTSAIRRVVCYEGAPPPRTDTHHALGLEDRLRDRLAAGDRAGALATFMTEVVGMRPADLTRFRADPVWPLRVAAAPTILRELEAGATPAASLDALGGVSQRVLQLLGGASPAAFHDSTEALHERLRHSEIGVIPGARHAAHHTHPGAVRDAVEAFLAD
jgi:pimeloyl-ACP methyl ester carboxylesterase